MMDFSRNVHITRYDGEDADLVEDIVVKEYPLTIYINGEELVTLLCSPDALNYLVFGFLISEGIIQDRNDIADLKIDEGKGIADVFTKEQKSTADYFMGKRMLTSGCGKGAVFYNIQDILHCKPAEDGLKIEPKRLTSLMRVFSTASELFQQTGGVHSAALSDGDNLLVYHEDIGRHNALDKVLGEAFLSGMDLSDKIILTSGRISSEMITKVAKRGIPMVVSRSAPMDLALQIGEAMNMTIIGFARGNRMNIYTGKHRIIFEQER